MFARFCMELDEENSLYGCGTTLVGAIFMSNRTTKRECFRRQIFGLPLSQAGFVKKIKTGMMLFLFEYEERKLHGVFEATSDGGLNIVPDAYTSSGKLFPAQIQWKRIWSCHPLSEHEFCDAIKGNYYAHNKFNFSLSEEQVSDLLKLFFLKKINTQKHQTSGRGRTVTPEFAKPGFGHSEDPGVGVEPYVPLSVSHAAESWNPDFAHSTHAFMDKVLICPSFHRVPGLQNDQCSITPADNSSVAQKQSAYSRDHIDSRGLLLGKQLLQFLPYPETLNAFTDNQSVDVTTSHKTFTSSQFPGYGPLRSTSHCSVFEDSEGGSDFIDLQDYEPQSSSEFCEPSHGYEKFPPSDDGYFGKKITNFSGSPHMSPSKSDDRHISESKGDSCLQHRVNSRVLRYWHHGRDHLPLPEDERGDEISEYSSLGSTQKYMSEVQNKYMTESKDSDGSERTRPNHPTEFDEYYPTVVTNFHSDNFERRSSVFSRLSIVPNPRAEEDVVYEQEDQDLSDNQLMELLSKRKHQWSKLKVSKQVTQGDDEQLSSIVPFETSGVTILDEEEGFYCSEEATEESSKLPFLNFKRRSEVRKSGCESDTTNFAEMSSVKNKKRKLIRPSFIGEFFIRDKSQGQDVQIKSHELFLDQALVKSSNGEEGVESQLSQVESQACLH